MKKHIFIGILFLVMTGCSLLTPKQEEQIDKALLMTRMHICNLPEPLKKDIVGEMVAAKIFHPEVCVGVGE